MIDLHNHILPGVDDGAKAMDESVEMARVAQSDGIGVVVATPHRNAWSYHAERADALRRLAELDQSCRQAALTVQLLLGGEAYVAPDLAEQVQTGLALTLNGGRYLLVEWPVDQYPGWIEEALFTLQVRGICPIIAHAERYRVVQREPERLARLVDRGVLVQITAASLLGPDRHADRQTAELLARRGLAHLIATDSHSPSRRPPRLSPARERASEIVGQARAWAMVRDAPRQVIENQTVELPPPDPAKSRSFWTFWK